MGRVWTSVLRLVIRHVSVSMSHQALQFFIKSQNVFFLNVLSVRFKFRGMKKGKQQDEGQRQICLRDTKRERDRKRWRKDTDGDNERYFGIIYKGHSRPIRAGELKRIDGIDTGIQSDIPVLPALIPFSRTRIDQSEPLMTRNYTFNDQWVMLSFRSKNTFTCRTMGNSYVLP